jgi:hypothetical protein
MFGRRPLQHQGAFGRRILDDFHDVFPPRLPWIEPQLLGGAAGQQIPGASDVGGGELLAVMPKLGLDPDDGGVRQSCALRLARGAEQPSIRSFLTWPKAGHQAKTEPGRPSKMDEGIKWRRADPGAAAPYRPDCQFRRRIPLN